MGICLNMIVRNEAANLPKLFASLPGQVDYFVIADTGSTDDTPDLIKRLSSHYGIPGKVTRHDWVDFSTNRNLALKDALASMRAGEHDCDRLMILDADEELQVLRPGWRQTLRPGITYTAISRGDRLSVCRNFLLWLPGMEWTWKGRVHNHITAGSPYPHAHLEDLYIRSHLFRGGKSHGFADGMAKASADAIIMEEELRGLNPYRELAHRFFQWAHVLFLGGSADKAEEIFASLATDPDTGRGIRYASAIMAGRCGLSAGSDLGYGGRWFVVARTLDPLRREALFYQALTSTDKRKALALLDEASRIDPPRGAVFYLEHDLYEWRTRHQRIILLAGLGEIAQACREASALIETGILPETERGFLTALIKKGGVNFA